MVRLRMVTYTQPEKSATASKTWRPKCVCKATDEWDQEKDTRGNITLKMD